MKKPKASKPDSQPKKVTVSVATFALAGGGRTAELTRRGNRYFADGKSAPHARALKWYAEMELNADSVSAKEYTELPRFLLACARGMKGGAR